MTHGLSLNSKVDLQSSNVSCSISIQRSKIFNCNNCVLPQGIRFLHWAHIGIAIGQSRLLKLSKKWYLNHFDVNDVLEIRIRI